MKIIKIACLFMLALGPSLSVAGDLPNARMTPGVTNPDVTQENIKTTVCVKGYTKTIRPPAFYTNRLKKQQIGQYGYLDADPRHYEEDHLIALSIGGAPYDPRNLWPQPRNSEWNAKKKDELEFALYKLVCAGKVSLQQAQQDMASRWIDAYKKYVPANQPHHGFSAVD